MFDDLRQQADAGAFDEEEVAQPIDKNIPYKERRFLGMTAFQRFVIAVMLFIIVCLLGTLCLLVSEKIVLPFL